MIYQQANTTGAETDHQAFSNAASSDFAGAWNDTLPTSSVFTIGTSAAHNVSGQACMAYVFTEIEGFSRYGVFTGNGNADGPVIHCGFTPALIWIKERSAIDSWFAYDHKRQTHNGIIANLILDTTAAESSSTFAIDFLANGFKVRNADGANNTNQSQYIFCAWALHPFGGEDVTPAPAMAWFG